MASYNPKNADWYGTGLGVALDTAVGDIFYVSEGGLDTNDGLTPPTALLTITAAHDLCNAGDNDYIIILDYNINHGEAAWPIPLNKSDVHIIGSLHCGLHAPSHFVVGIGDDLFQIGADRIEIAGLSLGAPNDKACIMTDGSYWAQLHVHHCEFAHTTQAQDGIRIGAEQSWNWEIDHCLFGQDTAGIIRDGIRSASQVGRMYVHDNVFYIRDPGHGIWWANALGCVVERNTFKVPDIGAGEAITILAASGANQGTFNNNCAMSSTSAMTFNPYRDLGGSNWGYNSIGITPAFPITV